MTKAEIWVRRIATTLSNKGSNDPKALSTVTDREIVFIENGTRFMAERTNE